MITDLYFNNIMTFTQNHLLNAKNMYKLNYVIYALKLQLTK